MSVKSYPTKTPDLVSTLTNTDARSMGWQPPPTPVTVLSVAEQDEQAGERVKALREAKGWSREVLAYHADVSSKTIERIEKGQVEGRRHTFRSIAQALEVDEYSLIGEPPGTLGVPLSTQVDGGFEEFRGYVRDLEGRLERIENSIGDLAQAIRQLARRDDLAPPGELGRRAGVDQPTTPDHAPAAQRRRAADAGTGTS